MIKLKSLDLGILLAPTLFGCTDYSSKIEEMDNAVVSFRDVDHNLHTFYWIKGDLKLTFYENYVKVEEKKKKIVHYVRPSIVNLAWYMLSFPVKRFLSFILNLHRM